MAGNAPYLDYLCIILIAGGVVALGAHELRDRYGTNEEPSTRAEVPVIREFREDLSGKLTEGAPASELAPKDLKEAKARYPWKSDSEKSQKEPRNTEVAPESRGGARAFISSSVGTVQDLILRPEKKDKK